MATSPIFTVSPDAAVLVAAVLAAVEAAVLDAVEAALLAATDAAVLAAVEAAVLDVLLPPHAANDKAIANERNNDTAFFIASSPFPLGEYILLCLL